MSIRKFFPFLQNSKVYFKSEVEEKKVQRAEFKTNFINKIPIKFSCCAFQLKIVRTRRKKLELNLIFTLQSEIFMLLCGICACRCILPAHSRFSYAQLDIKKTCGWCCSTTLPIWLHLVKCRNIVKSHHAKLMTLLFIRFTFMESTFYPHHSGL